MEKIKSRSQMMDDLKLELVRKAYNIELIDSVCAANRYLERHREDLLEYILRNISIDITISPNAAYSGDDNREICNNIFVSFINNDLQDIANQFVGLDYESDDEDDEYDEDRDESDIDPHTKFICEAVYEYIEAINVMLIRTLQIRSVEFNYVSRMVLITPMSKNRLSYYELLLKEIVLETYSAIDVEEIVYSIVG